LKGKIGASDHRDIGLSENQIQIQKQKQKQEQSPHPKSQKPPALLAAFELIANCSLLIAVKQHAVGFF